MGQGPGGTAQTTQAKPSSALPAASDPCLGLAGARLCRWALEGSLSHHGGRNLAILKTGHEQVTRAPQEFPSHLEQTPLCSLYPHLHPWQMAGRLAETHTAQMACMSLAVSMAVQMPRKPAPHCLRGPRAQSWRLMRWWAILVTILF